MKGETVEKTDILKMGHLHYEENGMLCIRCDFETANNVALKLSTILDLWGKDYRITESNTNEEENGDESIVLKTNLPYEAVYGINGIAITCCICGRQISFRESDNPWPIGGDTDRCCHECNFYVVQPLRSAYYQGL